MKSQLHGGTQLVTCPDPSSLRGQPTYLPAASFTGPPLPHTGATHLGESAPPQTRSQDSSELLPSSLLPHLPVRPTLGRRSCSPVAGTALGLGAPESHGRPRAGGCAGTCSHCVLLHSHPALGPQPAASPRLPNSRCVSQRPLIRCEYTAHRKLGHTGGRVRTLLRPASHHTTATMPAPAF